jgi:hypothetical protein
MTIDTSGKWWVGDSPEDLDEYLQAYTSDSYQSKVFRLARCACGSEVFELEADDEEGVARRTCVACRRVHYICESDEYLEDARPKKWRCVVGCRSTQANVGVGFAVYDDDPTGIKWLYVGERCAKCGVLGCFAGWKVAESDALHLMDKV